MTTTTLTGGTGPTMLEDLIAEISILQVSDIQAQVLLQLLLLNYLADDHQLPNDLQLPNALPLQQPGGQ